MITVEEAISQIDSIVKIGSVISVSVEEATGYVLAEDVHSPIDMPPFRQSAMDGYGLSFDENISSYKLIGEVAAGSDGNIDCTKGEAVRIFTGARVPDSVDTVIQQEWVNSNNGSLTFDREIKTDLNIRPAGEQIKVGELAVQKGIIINPATVGFLSTLGITELKVLSKPTVSIITTGDELVKPGQQLEQGKIFESNSSMLKSALESKGYLNCSVSTVPDDFEATKEILKQEIDKSDFLVITGGVSVGEYDFVGKALLDLGVEQHFHEVRQKPGKPLFFGSIDNTMIFGLPGNPAAALSCFYIYVLRALDITSGKPKTGLRKVKAKLSVDYQKKGDRAQFLKSYYHNGQVDILGSQSSAMLNTFAQANALTYISIDQSSVKKGTEVDVYQIPE